ncbi:MAG TPA: hypothetical protein VNK41_00400 [Vicinamibacterales bacterium]|nr:hypothetical protein [Vicinamibacterales bacterium]
MRRLLTAVAIGLSAPAVCSAQNVAPPTKAVRAVFRVFSGTQEITAETRLAVRPSGSDKDAAVLTTPPLAVDLEPGIYDVQAIHHKEGRVIGVRWAERLVIQKYPDERDEHLQVINLKAGFGALQIQIPLSVRPDPAAVTVKAAGGAPAADVRVVGSKGYLLIVAPAGTYDVTVALPGGTETFSGVEIPADRTRMRPAGGDRAR